MSNFISIKESQTLLINQQSKVLESKSIEVFKFGFGQSPFHPPQSVIKSLQLAADRKDYSPVQGLEELRDSIACFHKDINGIIAKAEDVLVAPGSKVLLWLIMASFKKVDVLIPSPAWVSYEPQVRLLGHHPIAIETCFEQKWRVTQEKVKKCVAFKKFKDTIMILNYPGNPDGLSYSEEEIKELASLARELDILVISDEIYGLLSHSAKHHSFANYYPEKTITTTGLSKWCGAGGWRLGAAICSPGISVTMKNTMIGIASEIYSCAPTPVQISAITAYQNSTDIRKYLDAQNKILAQIGKYIYEEFQNTEIRLHKPQGGFYLFPDFSAYKDRLVERNVYTSVSFTEALLRDTGVALLPGNAFGMADTLIGARLAYVDFKTPVELSDFNFEKHTDKLQRGIKKIIGWLEKI